MDTKYNEDDYLLPGEFQIQQASFLNALDKKCKKGDQKEVLDILKNPDFTQYTEGKNGKPTYIKYQTIVTTVLLPTPGKEVNLAIAIPLLVYAKCLPFKNPQATYNAAIGSGKFNIASLVFDFTALKKQELIQEIKAIKPGEEKIIDNFDLHKVEHTNDIWWIYRVIELSVLDKQGFTSYFDYCKSRFMYGELGIGISPEDQEIMLCSSTNILFVPNEVLELIMLYKACESREQFMQVSRMNQTNSALESVIDRSFKEKLAMDGITLPSLSHQEQIEEKTKAKPKNQKCLVM